MIRRDARMVPPASMHKTTAAVRMPFDIESLLKETPYLVISENGDCLFTFFKPGVILKKQKYAGFYGKKPDSRRFHE